MNRHERQTGSKRMTTHKPLSLRAEIALIVVAFVVLSAAWTGVQVAFPQAAPYVTTLLIGAGLGALSLMVATTVGRWIPRRKPTEEDA